jgi:cytidylate kinase
MVRQAMVKQQHLMGKDKGIVMDGRDIGTVVFPQAELKIFLTALPEIRAKRRFDELQAKGETISFDEVLKNTIERDKNDMSRTESPLLKADDALLLDNSYLSPEQQTKWIRDAFNKVLESV